ncbi:Toxin YoeB [Fundidesulfovibrio magnetotacticus]|uniref:Putative mRNA interferase YoeB n=1 Tax=Fundidesulfovibrio magnetotacticus TaxID=2730080 RepID=A0A6V8LZE5_9BACT|nr:Txe/YoeB family addiction module toxin [Fundidesulfovibrio magnetotacticus]GFK95921.1 Toxin YoeB [Fundidesulfovibrio magnetotacticus]
MIRLIAWTPGAWEDYLCWQRTNKAMLRKLNELILAVCRSPFEGIGKPEPLRFDLGGSWSRRIDAEHRLLYRDEEETLVVLGCRYHY